MAIEPRLFEDARILFRNFEGREDKFNQAGARNFCLVLDPETAEDMAREGWNVKTRSAKEPGDSDLVYVKVAVNPKGPRPAVVVLISSKGRTTLPEDLWMMIDYADIETVDLMLNPYEWVVNRNTGVKAYLKSIYVTIREDRLERKYAHLPEINIRGEQLAIGGAQEPTWDYEGEIIDEEQLALEG